MDVAQEQGVYDMFRLPFVMPQSGEAPGEEASKEDLKVGYNKGGLPGMAAKMKGKVTLGDQQVLRVAIEGFHVMNQSESFALLNLRCNDAAEERIS